MDNITTKKTCDKCGGCGLIKMETIICDLCKGIKCIRCRETGFIQLPYETCDTCDGLGTIIK